MQAVVLAGGRGQRLHPLTADVPKPLVPVMGSPLLGQLLDHLQRRGVDEAFVTAGYLGSAIVDFLQATPQRMPVHVVQEDTVRGTAGAVADLLPALHAPFLVVSGDSVIDLALDTMVAVHRATLAEVTIGAAPLVERLRFGVIAAHGSRVQGFVEKPALDELMPEAVVNTGCYLLERSALADVPAHGAVDFARDIFPKLLLRGGRIAVAPGLRYWRDIGTADAFRDIHLDAVTGDWPWGLPHSLVPAHLARSAEVLGPVVYGREVTVAAGARLQGPLYVGDGVAIGVGAKVARSVLLAGSRVGAHAEVNDAVVDTHGSVPAGAAVSGAILGRTHHRPTAVRTIPGLGSAGGTQWIPPTAPSRRSGARPGIGGRPPSPAGRW